MQPEPIPQYPVNRWRRATLISAFAGAISVAFVACGDDAGDAAKNTPVDSPSETTDASSGASSMPSLADPGATLS
ncbi:MAG: hypothetical protein R3C29_11485 [Dehalococcoidia bacterium]